jgi:hypothetical protein
MSWELYYTSAPQGLKPHSQGFCTVAQTEGMPGTVADRLESLSNYQPVFPAGSKQAELNPIAWAHWRIPVGTRSRSVVSRVAFVGSDFSGRPGKFAHHVLLEPTEQPAAGPAWLLQQPGMMEASWSDEPMLLPSRTIMVSDDEQPKGGPISEHAARLAEAFRVDPEKPAYIIYDPATQVLPVLTQAILLLPEALRWQVTFNTCFAELPAGLSCAWRGVVANTVASAAAKKARGLVIELNSRPVPSPPGKG